MSQEAAYRLEDHHDISDSMQGKYLTFQLGDEEYGIRITSVREIVGMMKITHVPQTDLFFKGVINLRGKIVPVIDLRLKFGMQAVDYTERSCIIVVEVKWANKHVVIGLIVDTVTEVNNIKTDEIEKPPSLGTEHAADFISGMAKKEDSVKMLLDIHRILDQEELAKACDAV